MSIGIIRSAHIPQWGERQATVWVFQLEGVTKCHERAGFVMIKHRTRPVEPIPKSVYQCNVQLWSLLLFNPLIAIFILATIMFSCDGCHSKFNRQGDLIQHLQKSENLLCATARESLQQKMRPVPGGRAFTPTQNPSKHHMTTPPATGPSSEWVEGHQTAQFEGDFFGNDYDDTDFPFPEDVPVGSDKVDLW